MASDIPFMQIQTQSAWGRTLAGFATWTEPQPGWTALDVGSGPGLLPMLLSERGCRSYGCDLDMAALRGRLHPALAQADAVRLPFPSAAFDLVTASNVLFLLPDPAAALSEMTRLLRPGGIVALLNPSEHMSIAAATELADARGLTGLDRDSLLGWAARAEANYRWNAAELSALFAEAGLQMVETVLKVGPGLARWAKAVKSINL